MSDTGESTRGPPQTRVDKTITLGNILTIAALVFGVFTAWFTMGNRVSTLENQQKDTMERVVRILDRQIATDTTQDAAFLLNRTEVRESIAGVHSKLDILLRGSSVSGVATN